MSKYSKISLDKLLIDEDEECECGVDRHKDKKEDSDSDMDEDRDVLLQWRKSHPKPVTKSASRVKLKTRKSNSFKQVKNELDCVTNLNSEVVVAPPSHVAKQSDAISLSEDDEFVEAVVDKPVLISSIVDYSVVNDHDENNFFHDPFSLIEEANSTIDEYISTGRQTGDEIASPLPAPHVCNDKMMPEISSRIVELETILSSSHVSENCHEVVNFECDNVEKEIESSYCNNNGSKKKKRKKKKQQKYDTAPENPVLSAGDPQFDDMRDPNAETAVVESVLSNSNAFIDSLAENISVAVDLQDILDSILNELPVSNPHSTIIDANEFTNTLMTQTNSSMNEINTLADLLENRDLLVIDRKIESCDICEKEYSTTLTIQQTQTHQQLCENNNDDSSDDENINAVRIQWRQQLSNLEKRSMESKIKKKIKQ